MSARGHEEARSAGKGDAAGLGEWWKPAGLAAVFHAPSGASIAAPVEPVGDLGESEYDEHRDDGADAKVGVAQGDHRAPPSSSESNEMTVG